MSKIVPSLVIRAHDPARARRTWLLLALAWLGTALVVAAVASALTARSGGGDVREKLGASERDSDALKARVAVFERSEQVAKAALSDLQQSLRERDEEIDALRADLAFYGRLVGGTQREGLAVHLLSIKPVKDSKAWNFIATLTQNFKRGQEVKGRLTLSVEGVRDGKLTTIDWAALSQGESNAGIEYRFKYFQQVGGTIMLPPGFAPNRVSVRADGESGRVDQEFTWADAVKGEESDDVRK